MEIVKSEDILRGLMSEIESFLGENSASAGDDIANLCELFSYEHGINFGKFSQEFKEHLQNTDSQDAPDIYIQIAAMDFLVARWVELRKGFLEEHSHNERELL